jgi:hypothetical protein
MTDSLRLRQWILIAAAFAMMVGMQRYFDDVFVAAQEAKASVQGQPHGNLSDLYIRWRGARELLVNHRDPYGPAVTALLQEGYWGHTLNRANPNDPVDEARFAYPLYVVFLLAPTVGLQFGTVQIIYAWIAIACTIASVWCWLSAFEHRLSFTMMSIGSMLLLGSFPVVQAFRLQQPVLIVAALLAAAVCAAASGVYWAAGIALALAMIKPQSALPIAGWLVLWSISNWRERKLLPISLAASLAALCGGAELLMPGWIWEWRDAIRAYATYNGGTPPHLQLMFGAYIGGAVGIVLLVGVVLFCWKARRDAASSDRFKLASALILAVSLAANPVWHEYDLIFLLPAILLAFHWRDEFALMNFAERAVVGISGIALGWQWIAAVAVRSVAVASPELAQSWRILPWLSVFFAPTCALAGLIVIARVRLAQTRPLDVVQG